MPIKGKTLSSSNFTFSIDGQVLNTVFKIRRIEQRVEVLETRSGDAVYITKQPVRLEPIRLEIQKVSMGKDDLAKWRSLVKDTGEPVRCSMAIGLVDQSHKNTLGEFSFQEAYPVVWKMMPLNARESGRAVEVLEIVSERMDYTAKG